MYWIFGKDSITKDLLYFIVSNYLFKFNFLIFEEFLISNLLKDLSKANQIFDVLPSPAWAVPVQLSLLTDATAMFHYYKKAFAYLQLKRFHCHGQILNTCSNAPTIWFKIICNVLNVDCDTYGFNSQKHTCFHAYIWDIHSICIVYSTIKVYLLNICRLWKLDWNYVKSPTAM